MAVQIVVITAVTITLILSCLNGRRPYQIPFSSGRTDIALVILIYYLLHIEA